MPSPTRFPTPSCCLGAAASSQNVTVAGEEACWGPSASAASQHRAHPKAICGPAAPSAPPLFLLGLSHGGARVAHSGPSLRVDTPYNLPDGLPTIVGPEHRGAHLLLEGPSRWEMGPQTPGSPFPLSTPLPCLQEELMSLLHVTGNSPPLPRPSLQ